MRALAALIAITCAAAPVAAVPATWTTSWAAAQQAPEPANRLPDASLRDATLRQVVRLSIGGRRLRLRVSNLAGTAPLVLAGVHVALAGAPGSAAILPGTDRAVAFDGQWQVTVPAGASYLSDPLAMVAAPLARLAISIRFVDPPEGQTGHPGSRATSFVAAGDALAAADLPDARRVEHWYQLAAVEVEAAPDAGVLVALGDSITDGHGATTDGDDRWPDLLAARLQAAPATARWGIANAGIGGNRLLLDGLGPNALARLDRDVLAQPGVRAAIVLEGVNDLGTFTRDGPQPAQAHAALVAHVIGAYRQIVARAHARGVRVIGGTITPYGGSDYYHPDAANEADRQAVNAWIRAPGHFDGVADFDATLRDPAEPGRLLAAYDSGDHLHPSPAGYRAMADAVPVMALR